MRRAADRDLWCALLLGAALVLAGCGHPPPPPVRGGVVHVVKPGETIYRIARHYGVDADQVVRANAIRDVRSVRPGTRLHIPGARRPAAHAALAPAGNRSGVLGRPRGDVAAPAARARARAAGLDFGWPLRGQLTSRYGFRRGRRHEGIDVAQRRGTPVHAAEAGRVIYSGNGLGAYGNVVIVRHHEDFATVYAHNRKNRVRKGARVAKGEVIAELGASGNATGPHLHFEVRERDRARDPLHYLP